MIIGEFHTVDAPLKIDEIEYGNYTPFI